ncbi:MAG: type II secretion system protein GspM [Desulfobacteraceae bacterium]|nr:type II secretion system protein GspM [Desulfobacteraceae bacterium]
MFKIDQRKKIILSVGSFLLVAAILYRVYPLVENVYPTADKIDLLETQLAGYNHQLGKKKQLKSRMQDSTKFLSKLEANLFRGDTPALAAVEIQAILDSIVSENNIEISSIQVVEGGKLKELPYGEVTVRLTFGATIAQLKHFLYAIETSSQFLKVTETTIRSSSRGSIGKRFLGVTMVITGLMDRLNIISDKE